MSLGRWRGGGGTGINVNPKTVKYTEPVTIFVKLRMEKNKKIV